MATFEDLEFKPSLPNMEQAVIFFENGYGASVITGEYAYAGEGEYEIALIKGDKNGWCLCDNRLLKGTVLGYQSPEDITKLLQKIEKLK